MFFGRRHFPSLNLHGIEAKGNFVTNKKIKKQKVTKYPVIDKL